MEHSVRAELEFIADTIKKTVPVEQIFLFGSHAYGEPTDDSDPDIYVVISDGSGIREIDAVKMIYRAIRHRKTMSVDLIVAEKSKFGRRKRSPAIERRVLEEGVLLHGQP